MLAPESLVASSASASSPSSALVQLPEALAYARSVTSGSPPPAPSTHSTPLLFHAVTHAHSILCAHGAGYGREETAPVKPDADQPALPLTQLYTEPWKPVVQAVNFSLVMPSLTHVRRTPWQTRQELARAKVRTRGEAMAAMWTRADECAKEFVNSASAGDLAMMTRLRCTIPINAKHPRWGQTALHAASAAGQLPCVRYLVTCGANINAKSRSGLTALMLAARASHLDVVEYLIHMGADASITTPGNWTVHTLGVHVSQAIARALEHRREFLSKSTDFNQPRSVLLWSEEEVATWLTDHDLKQYAELFQNFMVDGDLLLDLEPDDLDEMGVHADDAPRLAALIELLRMGPDVRADWRS